MSRTTLTDILPFIALVAILSLVLIPVLSAVTTLGSPLAALPQQSSVAATTLPAANGSVQLASAPTTTAPTR